MIRCLCGAQFCYLCGQKWKSCDCAHFEEGQQDGPQQVDGEWIDGAWAPIDVDQQEDPHHVNGEWINGQWVPIDANWNAQNGVEGEDNDGEWNEDEWDEEDQHWNAPEEWIEQPTEALEPPPVGATWLAGFEAENEKEDAFGDEFQHAFHRQFLEVRNECEAERRREAEAAAQAEEAAERWRQAHAARVATYAEIRRTHAGCPVVQRHEAWVFRRGSDYCKACGEYLPVFLLECANGCGMLVCRWCSAKPEGELRDPSAAGGEGMVDGEVTESEDDTESKDDTNADDSSSSPA